MSYNIYVCASKLGPCSHAKANARHLAETNVIAKEELLPADAIAPRSLSGVPVKPCWAATVGTYSSLQENADSLNGKAHFSSSSAWPDMLEYLVHGGISSAKECVWQGCFIKPCGNLCSLSAVANT